MTSYYLDHNATTPIAPKVFEAMQPFLTEDFGNPSSLHHAGNRAARAIREARKKVAALLGTAEDKEIIFTSGGTESNNAAIRSALALSGKKEIVTSAVEHSSIRKLCRQLEKEGCRVREVGVDSDGRLNLEALRQSLSDQTAVVSLMMANNETGVIFPIEKAGAMIKERNILFHVDAVQAAGKLPFQLKSSFADYVSISAHKFYGPKGIGALVVRNGVLFHPLIWGGGQERGRRPGTENVAAIAGMGAAGEIALQNLEPETARLGALRDQFEEMLLERKLAVRVNGSGAPRLSNTSNLRFDVDGEALLLALDQKGICASSGSACMSGAQEPSYVLKAMGASDEEANASVRFSFGRFNKGPEIFAAVILIEEIISRLRSVGPVKESRLQTGVEIS